MGETKHITTKTELTIALIITLLLSITGTTYAYFAFGVTNNNTLTGDAATVNLTLGVTRVYPTASSTNTGVIVPQLSTSNSATSPLASALKSGCVDGNTNVICHVYKITIANQGGSATQVVDGKISFFGNAALTTNIATAMPNLKWRSVTSVNETNANSSVLGANVDHSASSTGENFISNLTMVTNSSFTYYIIVWLNETNTNQTTDVGKTFYGKVEFNSSNGTGVTAAFA